MRRREVVASLLLAAATAETQAQQPRGVPRVGVVHPSASRADMAKLESTLTCGAFFEELRRSQSPG